MMHFKVSSEEVWHRIGDNLAPKALWSPLLHGRPGLESLEISSMPERDNALKINVKVQPSKMVAHGVYFEINNHHPAAGSAGLSGFMDILKFTWEGKQNEALNIALDIIQQAGEQQGAE